MSDRFHVNALRPEDLLALEFEFVNLQPVTGGILERISPVGSALVIVHFPSQHIAEQAFAGNPGTIELPPVRAAMAGKSRLVFRLPDATSSLPFTLESLLKWETWELVVASGPPNELETAVELPWRLILSPGRSARWRHNLEPVTLNGNTELWRTQLTPGAIIHALAAIEGEMPFPTSPTTTDRRKLVDLTTTDEAMLGTQPMSAELFSLSTLGASAHLHGQWPQSSLVSYEHIVAQGRDQLVRTVYAGFLCGTGHRAVVITTIERAPVTRAVVGHSEDGGALFGTIAYLHQRWEVIIEESMIDYASMTGAYAFNGREMPLRSIQLITLTAEIQGTPGVPFLMPTWLLTPEGKPLFFRAKAIDLAGNQIDFELPLMFVPLDSVANIGLIRNIYQAPPFNPNLATRIPLGGQPLAMAAPLEKPESTQVKANNIRFGLATVGDTESGFGLRGEALPASYKPRYLPYIKSTLASIPAVEQLLGRGEAKEIVHDFNYLKNDFNPATNPAQSFARLPASLAMEFASQQGGGLVRPSSVAEALSRTLGAIAAPDALAAGKIDLSSFNQGRFLGTIRLLDIIPGNLPFDPASAGANPPDEDRLDDPGFRLNQPRLITRRIQEGPEPGVETRFLWKPSLVTKSFGLLTLDLDSADLLLDARTVRSPSMEGKSRVIGRLRNAALSFPDAITVSFGELLFRAEEGRKLEFGAKNVNLVFNGPLEFVNSLRSILPANGFNDPPSLTVDGQGIIAEYTLGIPSVGVGIFSLLNIGLSAAVSIPFTDRPAGVRFAISERHKPFLVTVSLFGGGGFFALAVSANGLEQIEASIEFGGNIALNLVIASGGVYVMAGIYFALTAGSVSLTGFLRCGGYLEVLGLISVSVEFYLALAYRKKDSGGSEVWGQASLTVCVKIAFFSKSVSLSVERRFAGSDGDPSFAETAGPAEWAEYLQAFA